MKILVTGGAGYIGSITTRNLLARGHDVVVYDNLSTGFRQAIPAGAKFVFGDIRDQFLVGRVMKDEKIEAVIHFAAKLIVPESVAKPLEYYDVNVMGGLATLKAAQKQGVRAFIFSSTAAVYGNPPSSPVNEDVPPAPLNPYGASKAMIERILTDFHRSHGLPSVSLRYFNVAGAAVDGSTGQRTEKATHLMKVAAELACGKRSSIEIFGTDYATPDGTGVRDYIHVEDLAEAHVRALDHLVAGGESLILNCGYGRGFSVREVLATMGKVSGQNLRIVESPRRPGDAGAVVADATRIRSLFDWTPKFDDLETICRSAYDWERSLG